MAAPAVLIDRSNVVQTLRAGGRTEEARRAELVLDVQVLDVQVDTVRDDKILRDLGVHPDRRAMAAAWPSAEVSPGLLGRELTKSARNT
jgi:hypothetical protein